MASTKAGTENPGRTGKSGHEGRSVHETEGSSGTDQSCLAGFSEFVERDQHQSVGNEGARNPPPHSPAQQGETEFPVAAPVSREAAFAALDESELLDAWYASFASPATRALVLRQKQEGGPLAEVVIGPDDRQQITNVTAYPWRSICSLSITAGDGSRWIGTGWFAGPRLIVTAGHCVFMRDNGGWVRSIDVMAGRNGSTLPYGTRTCTTFRSVTGWTQRNDRNFDYGAIFLSGGTALGSQVGFFGLAAKSDADLRASTLNLSGYPGDKPVGTQWWHARGIDQVTASTIIYQIDSAGGQSGAPVWFLQNNARTAVGVHTNGAASGNSATRINQSVLDNLVRWKADAGQ
jgi:glutamyl endopeptidase